MDEATILKSWLTISYSKKRADENNIKEKTPAGRTPLGDKGLGRLSTQRLADCCEIFTCSDGSNEKLHVAFDWREFDKADQLSKVPVFFERVSTSQGKGTKLILTNLHRPATWEGDELASLKGQLSQLISPFIENRPFLVYMTVNGESINIVQKIHGVYIQPDHTGQPSAFPQGRAPERAASGVFLLFCPEVSGNRSEKYGKPVVVIIAATAQSHAEYCVQCMQANPDVTVIGTQSAGTNGNISVFVLPGGIRSCFSGLDWHYPGGWCVQGQGVRFDLEVEPTIVGIRAGRNETREAAVETINDRFPRG